MTTEESNTTRAHLNRLIPIVFGSPWLEILAEAWKVGRKLWRGMAEEGMYEVLEYESVLELQDERGEHAHFRKRERIRYLQNNIIAYQDFAWGDGQILLNYRCTPGKVVDRYRPGQTTFILISLRETKRRGDIDDFNIEWGIRNGFIRPTELWETTFKHRTRRFKMQVIFPKERPPSRVLLIEEIRRRTRLLEQSVKVQLPDGRWSISWEMEKPRKYERYLLKWDW
ncbi:MAG: hypothetical protein MN733_10685 [Nitrososphaera sp.]|nr:hypothetical protein [Nitrososphaera sp.]